MIYLYLLGLSYRVQDSNIVLIFYHYKGQESDRDRNADFINVGQGGWFFCKFTVC